MKRQMTDAEIGALQRQHDKTRIPMARRHLAALIALAKKERGLS